MVESPVGLAESVIEETISCRHDVCHDVWCMRRETNVSRRRTPPTRITSQYTPPQRLAHHRSSTQSHTTRHVRHRQRHTEHTIAHEERTYSIVCELTSSLDTTPRALVSLCQHGNHQFIVGRSSSVVASRHLQSLCTTDTRRRYVTASSTRRYVTAAARSTPHASLSRFSLQRVRFVSPLACLRVRVLHASVRFGACGLSSTSSIPTSQHSQQTSCNRRALRCCRNLDFSQVAVSLLESSRHDKVN